MHRSTFRLHFNVPPIAALRRRTRGEAGAALVETALSMLVMLIFVFGVIEASMAVYSFHYLSNAAHEATRYAVVRGGSWTSSCDGSGQAGSGYGSSQCTASQQDIANFIANRDFPGINIQPSDVCVEYFSSVPSSASSACSPNTGPNMPGNIVQVTISYPYSFTLPGLPSYTWNLSSTSQMVIAQ